MCAFWGPFGDLLGIILDISTGHGASSAGPLGARRLPKRASKTHKEDARRRKRRQEFPKVAQKGFKMLQNRVEIERKGFKKKFEKKIVKSLGKNSATFFVRSAQEVQR